MRPEQLEYLQRNVIGQRAAALLIGKNADTELKQLYETLGAHNKKYWAGEPAQEIDFWNGFLGSLTGRKTHVELERDLAVHQVESALQRSEGNHLFLPNVERLFYRFDIEREGLFNATIRKIWSDHKTDLTIIGSVKTENCKEYKKTLLEYHFPFYFENWNPFYLE